MHFEDSDITQLQFQLAFVIIRSGGKGSNIVVGFILTNVLLIFIGKVDRFTIS